MVQRKSESSANVNNTGDDFNQIPVTTYTYMAWVHSLKKISEPSQLFIDTKHLV